MALGAGAGTRLRPLTIDRPKVLCPVAGRPLIDHALDRLASVTDARAVNVHESQPTLIAHLSDSTPSVSISVETGERLGTAGAIGNLRSWIDGRDVVVVNGDTWVPGSLVDLVEGWDRRSIRVLVAGPDPFGPTARVAGALMPWAEVEHLDSVPSGLWELRWRAALADGRIETVHHIGPFVDCATPADYLEANLAAAGGSSIGIGAVIEGVIDDCVVWDGARVDRAEVLHRAIRTDTGRTVLIRT